MFARKLIHLHFAATVARSEQGPVIGTHDSITN